MYVPLRSAPIASSRANENSTIVIESLDQNLHFGFYNGAIIYLSLSIGPIFSWPIAANGNSSTGPNRCAALLRQSQAAVRRSLRQFSNCGKFLCSLCSLDDFVLLRWLKVLSHKGKFRDNTGSPEIRPSRIPKVCPKTGLTARRNTGWRRCCPEAPVPKTGRRFSA